MKHRLIVWAAAAIGLVSLGYSQGVSTESQRLSPEQQLLRQATALAGAGDFETSWELLLLTPTGGNAGQLLSIERVGWRVAAVAGALRNRSDLEVADEFARFALFQSWAADGRTLSRGEFAEAGYWCAWLASEILSDRSSALAWIEEAAKADPDSERIRELNDRLAGAERAFPTR